MNEKQLNELESVEFVPFVLLGIACSYEKYFLPWLKESCESLNIDILKEEDFEITLAKISRILKTKHEFIMLTGEDCFVSNRDLCMIGIEVDNIPENNSLKRVKIDLYEDLVSMNILNEENDELRNITFWSDVLIMDKEMIENGEEK